MLDVYKLLERNESENGAKLFALYRFARELASQCELIAYGLEALMSPTLREKFLTMVMEEKTDTGTVTRLTLPNGEASIFQGVITGHTEY